MATGSRIFPSGAVTKNRKPLNKAATGKSGAWQRRIARAFEEDQEAAAHADEDESMSYDETYEEEMSHTELVNEETSDEMEIDKAAEEAQEDHEVTEDESNGEDTSHDESEKEDVSEDESEEEEMSEYEPDEEDEFDEMEIDDPGDEEHPDYEAYLTLLLIKKAKSELRLAIKEKEERKEEKKRELQSKRFLMADGKTPDEIVEDIKEYWGFSVSIEEAVSSVFWPKTEVKNTKPGEFYYIRKAKYVGPLRTGWEKEQNQQKLLDEVILASEKTRKPAREWSLDLLKQFHELAGLTFLMHRDTQQDMAKERHDAAIEAFWALDYEVRNRITAPARDKLPSTLEYQISDLKSTIAMIKGSPFWRTFATDGVKVWPRVDTPSSATKPPAFVSSEGTNNDSISSSTGLTNMMGGFALATNKTGQWPMLDQWGRPIPAVHSYRPPPMPTRPPPRCYAEMPWESPLRLLRKPRLFQGEGAEKFYLDLLKDRKGYFRALKLEQELEQEEDGLLGL